MKVGNLMRKQYHYNKKNAKKGGKGRNKADTLGCFFTKVSMLLRHINVTNYRGIIKSKWEI